MLAAFSIDLIDLGGKPGESRFHSEVVGSSNLLRERGEEGKKFRGERSGDTLFWC